MATKTERILSYLPGTFRRAPQRSALQAVVDAFGAELLQGENSLAAIMAAHWVDHADRGAAQIDDLACLAALYSLAPRPDETVEEFRRHLKRYVRTFLEGTVTVQGLLRITAEALGLRIADDYADIDSWWTRGGEELVTVEPRGDDAATLVLGMRTATADGRDAQPAQVVGTVDLRAGVDLRQATTLHLRIDNGDPVAIDLVAAAADRAVVTLAEILAALEQAGVAAEQQDGHLVISAPTPGLASRLEVPDGPNDAAEAVLGLAPHSYSGSAAFAASVRGTVDVSSGADLSNVRYLRLEIDGSHVREIDCAGANPQQTSLDEIRDAINAAFADLGAPVASHDGQALTLTSPSTGFNSSIAILPAAAQDASVALLDLPSTFFTGQDALRAQVTGRRDLSGGADLRAAATIQLRIDGESRTINCAGSDPGNTRPAEIVAAINRAFDFDPAVASHNGRIVTLRSSVEGPAGTIVFETPAAGDATEQIFGIGPRIFAGQSAGRARLVGTPDLSGGVDLRARHVLLVKLDDQPPREISLRAAADDPWAARLTLDDLVTAINNAFAEQPAVASHDGRHLILASPTSGQTSRLTLGPLQTTRHRRFVSQAAITDEASQAIFGFTSGSAGGTAATSARLTGSVDLGRGVDLQRQRYLRLAVDGYPPVEIDCAGKRPRATALDEVVAAINAALSKQDPALNQAAGTAGDHLVLASPTAGTTSRIALATPHGALEHLLGMAPTTVRGRPASGIRFVGTVDLSAGVELSPGAAIKLRIDTNAAKAIELVPAAAPGNGEPTEAAAVRRTLDQLKIAINVTLGQPIADHDGRHLALTLPPDPAGGGERELGFETPAGPDVTTTVFGITAPRSYRGVPAAAARLVGTRDLSTPVDLRGARFVRLAVDSKPAVEIDCAVEADDPAAVTLQNIIAAINNQLGSETAAPVEGRYLALSTSGTGSAASIVLEPYKAGDARAVLLGTVADETTGTDAEPAVLTGEADLLAPIDLSERRWLRLQIDDKDPIAIDVAGATPATTFLDEIVAAINAAVPGLAAPTDTDRLELRAASRVAVLPLRYLELIEYPPARASVTRAVRHGIRWSVLNNGAGATYGEVTLHARQGTIGPTLVNRASGWQLRLFTHLAVGATARLWYDPQGGLRAETSLPGQAPQPVPNERLLVRASQAEKWTVLDPQDRRAAEVLALPQGLVRWQYLDCFASRFDYARFDAACFAGLRLAPPEQPDRKGRPASCGICRERGIFDVSHFASEPPDAVVAVFAADPAAEPFVDLTIVWERYQPGAFCVNLPIDLPERFGGRFNQAYFGQAGGKPEQYPGAVSEPPVDEDYLVTLIKHGKAGRDDEGNPDPSKDIPPSNLVQAELVESVPLGWAAVQMPFRQPHKLTLGSPTQNARLYLTEEDLAGYIKLEARAPGAWANAISVTARKAGPARYDVAISYAGSHFENARQVVLSGGAAVGSACRHAPRPSAATTAGAGGDLPALILDLLQPGPVGVLHAKAAGIRAEVTRDRAYADDCRKEQSS